MKKTILLFLSFLFLTVTLYSQNIDIRVLRTINSPQPLSSDKFFRFVSNSNAYLVLGTPLGMGAVSLIKHEDQLLRNTCVIMAATVVNFGITACLKYSINRERPFVTYPDINKKTGAIDPSFPSGHTSSAFATATSLSLAYPKWYIIAPTYTWAGTVAYSRMELGVHYPTDVLAGALIGSGCAWLTHAVNKKLNINSKKNHKIAIISGL